MIDISKNELYIKGYEGAFKNYLEPKPIPLCRPRRSDGFIFILGGVCHYEFKDKYRCTAKKGDLLYLSKGSEYKMDVTERYDFICINFFFDCDTDRRSDVFSLRDTEKSENLFLRALKENSNGTLPGKLSLIYRIYNDLLLSHRSAYLQGDKKSKIEDAISKISSEFQGEISISHLARDAEMSEVYFRRLFQNVTGVSPIKYLTDFRVGRAKELLSEDYLSLDDIAERCGFSSTSYFCRVFKDSTGMTPGEFRTAQNF